MNNPYRDQVNTAGPCPRCAVTMLWNNIYGADIAECLVCYGVFVKMDTVRSIIVERNQDIAELLIEKFATHSAHSTIPDPCSMYVKCPCCTTTMTRTQFAKGAKVVIDVCVHCGVWFDIGEFGCVVDFIMHGGLQRAANRIAYDTKRNASAQNSPTVATTTVRVTNRFFNATQTVRRPLAPLQTAAVWSMFELLVKPTEK